MAVGVSFSRWRVWAACGVSGGLVGAVLEVGEGGGQLAGDGPVAGGAGFVVDVDFAEEGLVGQSSDGVVGLLVHRLGVAGEGEVGVEVGFERGVVFAAGLQVAGDHGEAFFEGFLFAGHHFQAHGAFEVGVYEPVLLVFDPFLLGDQFVGLARRAGHHLVEVGVCFLA
ncbi:MAG: hypothetical protein LBU05_07540 [Bifidobacteriaceae bacterium]|nr:hypothetical protein [Bifidobacteriaceae bacterium]